MLLKYCVSDRVAINPKLDAGGKDEVVTVTADALRVDTQSAAATGLVNGTQIRELFGEDVERARVVAMRLSEALASLRPLRHVRKCLRRLPNGRLNGAPGDFTGEEAGLLQVPCDDLDEFVGAARQGLHPLREAEVEPRATALRHLTVGDVAHEDVLERVLLVVCDRRGLQVRDEVADLELRETGSWVLGNDSLRCAEMRDSVASISQGGYNTTLDILRAGAPALVVPFADGAEDG